MDKLSQLNDQVCAFSAKVSASQRQLQSLGGSLNFACQVVHGSRTFPPSRDWLCQQVKMPLSPVSFDIWHPFWYLVVERFSPHVQWPTNDPRISRVPITFKRVHPSMILELSLLTTGLPALRRLPPRTPPTHTYFHLTGVLLVAVLTRHFAQISVSWSFSRFLSPPAAKVLLGQTNLSA